MLDGRCSNHYRPDSPAFLLALLAMARAAARLSVGWAVAVMAAVTAAITLSEGIGATHTIPAGVSYTAAAAVLFGVATYVRTLKQARRRAERIVVELRATRRADPQTRRGSAGGRVTRWAMAASRDHLAPRLPGPVACRRAPWVDRAAPLIAASRPSQSHGHD